MKNIKTEIKWAAIFIGMALLWMWLERIAGLHDVHIDKHALYTNFFAIPATIVVVFALLDKRRNDYNGIMSYKQSFISGAIITLIITLFNPVSQYIISHFITPDYFDNAIKYAVNAGEMTRPEAEEYFNLKSYIMQGFVGTPVMGLVTTAIVSIFVKRKTK
ncbi:MAG: DUF4199 domain-containing protein [Bacteroidales bacterium]|nr:DUF4199 domain-containing protein [Bacteroidales bacterium]MCF8334351.1 DUF4199 domain-containing protein [Bacteroidales bacterium]